MNEIKRKNHVPCGILANLKEATSLVDLLLGYPRKMGSLRIWNFQKGTASDDMKK